jgi:hypothetical protein
MKPDGKPPPDFIGIKKPQVCLIVSLLLFFAGLLLGGYFSAVPPVFVSLALVVLIGGGLFELAYRKNRPRWLRRFYWPASLGFAIPGLLLTLAVVLFG